MPKIILQNGEITGFQADAIVCPTDINLTDKANKWINSILDKAGLDLTKEISAIGRAEIGNAVITQAYNFKKLKHLIFFPISDQEDEKHKLNFILLHQALRSAFNLATLYNLKTLAIPLFSLKRPKEDFFSNLIKSLFGNENEKELTKEGMMNIIIGISREYKNTSLETITIYR